MLSELGFRVKCLEKLLGIFRRLVVFHQPIWKKMRKSNWIISQIFGVKTSQIFELPRPSLVDGQINDQLQVLSTLGPLDILNKLCSFLFIISCFLWPTKLTQHEFFVQSLTKPPFRYLVQDVSSTVVQLKIEYAYHPHPWDNVEFPTCSTKELQRLKHQPMHYTPRISNIDTIIDGLEHASPFNYGHVGYLCWI